MKVTRAASIPLVTHDPYFSIWSSSDHLYDTDTVHWTGKRQQIRGYLTVDKTVYCFMGDKEFHQILPQISLDVTSTATTYTFENDKVRLCCRFTSPLILSDPLLVSRPCTYIDFMVEKKNADNVQLDFIVSADLVRQEKGQALLELLSRTFHTRLWDVCVSSRLEAAVIIQQLTGVTCILQAMIKAQLHMMRQMK